MMLELNNWSEILSIVGAAAWLPIILTPIINFFRKLQATVLDSRILTDGKSTSAGDKNTTNGTILLLAINLYINKTTIFARKITLKLKLKNGNKLNSKLLDYSSITAKNNNGTQSNFSVPINEEFNISRTIHPNVDNIKYIAVIVEQTDFSNIDEIEEIELRLFYERVKCNILSKKVVIKRSDFPVFNSSHLIDAVCKSSEKGNDK